MITCRDCGALLASATSDCQTCGSVYDQESPRETPAVQRTGIADSGFADGVLVIASAFAALQSVLLLFICAYYAFVLCILGNWLLATAFAAGGLINSVLSFAMYIVLVRTQKPR